MSKVKLGCRQRLQFGREIMAGQLSPVRPEVLRWAVDEDGRPEDDLAGALKVDPEEFQSWLAGHKRPTRGQVTRLATVLQRPRAMFFLPKPPDIAVLPASFRHPAGEPGRDVSAAARRKVREARRIQHAVAWALRDESPVDVPTASTKQNPEDVAQRAREWLGISPEQQATWRDDYQALRAWREALQARGVLVFVLAIGRDEVRGFSAWDDHAPLIVANQSGVSAAARSFTLAHELGHLVTREDSACLEPVGSFALAQTGVERWCERFGASLLMPRAEMSAVASERGITDDASLDDVRAVTRRFRVSARAAAIRLIDLKYAPPTLYATVSKVFASAAATKGTPQSPPRYEARLRQYGPDVLRTVLTALPERDALSVLRVTVDDARRIAEEVAGVPTF